MINVSPTVTTNLTMLIYNIEGGGVMINVNPTVTTNLTMLIYNIEGGGND